LIDLRDLKQDLEFAAKSNRSTAAPSKMKIDKATAATKVQHAQTASSAEYLIREVKNHKLTVIAIFLVLSSAMAALYYFTQSQATDKEASTETINSIAVLPFVNESGDEDNEYLSDGMTESLINSLSQLPNLSVKARNSVFRYKGKNVTPQIVGNELNVEAVLLGRVVQRGEQLMLNLELVNAQTENVIWGERYNRRQADLISLQSEIARDVSNKLRTRLSRADEQKLAKNYSQNAEAYQLYLKGRYHIFKLTPPDIQKGMSYFQQAIEIDPNYALAYVGLSDAYRTFALSSEIPATEAMPKAKTAANKAIEIDDHLAEAHSSLSSIIFWYDWDWAAAENYTRRALELNPNNADAHFFYAYLLSNLGRHSEALAEAKRAGELDPLSLVFNALEGQFLLHAGLPDEALEKLQKTFDLDSNFALAHLIASSVYIEKGMYREAVAEARKVRELNITTSQPISFLGYALAKSGKQAEARDELERLLKLSKERYVSPYAIALIYNGLNERDEALAWLERGFEKRDPRMTFLKIEPKWNNLRNEPRFASLLKRMNLE
jgi:TolB-like protein/Tfp pilus assembly protein PilF